MIRQLEEQDISTIRSSVNISGLASVVLELVQNSLDAQANSIHVLMDVSRLKVEVCDDGCGIAPDDLRRWVGQVRHASSKKINGGTFGFRGEALASIAGLAKVVISSKHVRFVQGYKAAIQDNRLLHFTPSSIKDGTIVQVSNLFHRIPVRQMQDHHRELDTICKSLQVLALIATDCIVNVVDETTGQRVLHLPKTSGTMSTFRNLFGQEVAHAMRPFETTVKVSLSQKMNNVCEQVNFRGWFSVEGVYARTMQFVYVNRHHIAPCEIHRIIQQVYQQCQLRDKGKMQGSHPAFIVCLEAPEWFYQVAWDPLKSVVEFDDWKTILDLVEKAARDVLVSYGLLRKVEIKEPVERMALQEHDANRFEFEKRIKGGSAIDWSIELQSNFQIHKENVGRERARLDRRFLKQTNKVGLGSLLWAKDALSKWENPIYANVEQAVEAIKPSLKMTLTVGMLQSIAVIGQVDKKFIFGLMDGVLVVIDQHAASERIGLETLWTEFITPSATRLVTNVVPVDIPLNIPDREVELLTRFQCELSHWGIDLVRGDRWQVISLPRIISERCLAEPELIHEVIRSHLHHLLEHGPRPLDPSVDRCKLIAVCPSSLYALIASKACRSALMFGTALTRQECQELVVQLSKCVYPFQCAHGRPSIVPLLRL
jgi:DNA mismatch repair protein MLH3